MRNHNLTLELIANDLLHQNDVAKGNENKPNYTNLKTKALSAECPLGKWDTIATEEQEDELEKL